MSDNGANAESGPDGRFNGDPPGGPNSDLYLGMNWAAVGNTPFRRFKHFTHEGGISSPLIVHWPTSDRGQPARRDRAAAGASHRHHGDGDRGDRREVSERVQGPRDSSDGRRQSAAGARRPSAQPAATALLGARREPRRAFGQLEDRLRVSQTTWELYDIAADRVERNNVAAQHPDIVKRLCGRVGRVGQTDERGSVAGSGATAVGRQRTGPWRCGTAGRAGRTVARNARRASLRRTSRWLARVTPPTISNRFESLIIKANESPPAGNDPPRGRGDALPCRAGCAPAVRIRHAERPAPHQPARPQRSAGDGQLDRRRRLGGKTFPRDDDRQCTHHAARRRDW